jgi:uncharacterized membrane protein SirB2
MLTLNSAETLAFSCLGLLILKQLSPEINKAKWLEDKDSSLMVTEVVVVASAEVASEVTEAAVRICYL